MMRNTIVLTMAMGTALASCAGDGGFAIRNVVPMYIGHESEQAARCVEMEARTGEGVALYSLTLHPEGVPATEKVDRYIESYRRFAQALRGTRVTPAVLVQAILGHWPRTDKVIEPWRRTVDQDGKKVRFCPLDPGFGAYIDYVFTALAKEHPAFILTDDDVRAYSHGAECFCDAHVGIFNARHGTNHDSDSLRAAVRKSKPGDAVYEQFLALQREMMEQAVAGRIRRAIDAVDPTIRVGVCLAGEEHFFGDNVARVLAAKGQTPVMRVSTACYLERMGAGAFPWIFMRMQGFMEMLRGRNLDVWDEADTWPQNAWSKSARSFFTHLAAADFCGMKGAKTWYVNAVRANGVPVTKAYTDILAENRGFLDALMKAVEGSSFTGLAVPCFTKPRKWHMTGNHVEFMVEPNGAFETFCVPFGVPAYASCAFGDERKTFVLSSEREVQRFSDDELTRLFSGRVLVLRDAAIALAARGRADLIGVTVTQKPLLFNGERDLEKGTVFGASAAMNGSAEFRLADGAKSLGDLTFSPFPGSPDIESVSPSVAEFRNAHGGTAITVAWHPNMSSAKRLDEGRKCWFIRLVDHLAGKDAFTVCENDQDVLTCERVAPDGVRYVLAINLCSDPIRDLRLRLRPGAVLERLQPNGAWRKVDGPVPVGFYEAVVLRVK